jgi:Zn-dependent protease with chaperone function
VHYFSLAFRHREFDADQEATQITGYPEGFASALGKISGQGGDFGRGFSFLIIGILNPLC